MKTDRVTLLISPAEKAALTAKADQLGITVSELMRQAALAFDPDFEADIEELALMTSEMHSAVRHLQPKLELAFAEAALTRAHIARREADMQAALDALDQDKSIDWTGIRWLFGVETPIVGATRATQERSFRKLVGHIIDESVKGKRNTSLAARMGRVKKAEAKVGLGAHEAAS